MGKSISPPLSLSATPPFRSSTMPEESILKKGSSNDMGTRRQRIPRINFDISHYPMYWLLCSTTINPAEMSGVRLSFEMVVWFWPLRFEIRSDNRREGAHESERVWTIQTEFQETCCHLDPPPVSALLLYRRHACQSVSACECPVGNAGACPQARRYLALQSNN